MSNQDEKPNVIDRMLTKIFPKRPSPVASGIYHAIREVDGVQTRLHLRVEHDGSGILMANSSAAARLSYPGVVIAKGVLDGEPDDAIIKRLKKHFRGAPSEVMHNDIAHVQSLLTQITSPDMGYPLTNLDDFSAEQAQLIAPFKADVPLAPPDTIIPLIDKLWDIGIPNLMILVHENPEPAHIIRAIEHAEDLGMIAGVRGRASDIHQGSVLRDMAQAGVDYVTILYTAPNASLHDSLCGEGDHAVAQACIEQCLANEVCPVAEIALVESTMDVLDDTLSALKQMRVDTTSLFAIYADRIAPGTAPGVLPVQALPQVQAIVEEAADACNVWCIMQPSVEYDTATSLASQIRQGPRCSGNVAVRVEPHGAVIPAQGMYRSAGNILSDPWEIIWNDEAFTSFRDSDTKFG